MAAELFKPEYDKEVRDADISIHLSFVDRVGLDWACCKHWAVIVKFDNRTLAYEIIQIKDKDGISRITPKWSDIQNTGSFEKVIFLGTIKTSPQAVWNLAAKNSNNGEAYNTVTNNCQEWAKELLASMDANLLRVLNKNDIKTISQRVTEKIASSTST
jgi:hypothetical protein